MIKETIEVFEKLYIQIKDIHNELSILSKKSPDGAINKFKLKFVNQLLSNANGILEDNYKPFNDFILFQEDDIPTNSDVVLIISQYIKCLDKIKRDNVKNDYNNWYWITDKKGETIPTTRPPVDLIY